MSFTLYSASGRRLEGPGVIGRPCRNRSISGALSGARLRSPLGRVPKKRLFRLSQMVAALEARHIPAV